MIVTIVPDRRLPRQQRGFSYRLPAKFKQLGPGDRVRIPFRSSVLTGTIVAVETGSDRRAFAMKDVIGPCQPAEGFTSQQMRLAHWLAEKYFVSVATAIKLFRPWKNQRPREAKRLVRTSIEKIYSWDTLPEKHRALQQRADQLRRKKQRAMFLVPEYADLDRYAARLKFVHILDGRQTVKKQTEAFATISQKPGLVITTRVGLFFPWPAIHEILIDDEANESYKQWDQNPRYHTRELVAAMAGIHHCRIGHIGPVLALATVQANPKLQLRQARTENDCQLEIVDLGKQRGLGHDYPFSDDLLAGIDGALSANHRVVLFHNRRSESTIVVCNDCGTTRLCQRCSQPLRLIDKILRCIDSSHEAPSIDCPACGGSVMKPKGTGIEKVTQRLHQVFPKASLAVIDRESARGPIEADMTIGTSALLKRWSPDNVSLVVFLALESFAAGDDIDRHFQLWRSVRSVDLALAGQPQARLLLQTFRPDDRFVQWLAAGNDRAYLDDILNERKHFQYPPFTEIIRLLSRLPEKRLESSATKLAEYLRQLAPSGILVAEPRYVRSASRRFPRQAILLIRVTNGLPPALVTALQQLSDDWLIDRHPIHLSRA